MGEARGGVEGAVMGRAQWGPGPSAATAAGAAAAGKGVVRSTNPLDRVSGSGKVSAGGTSGGAAEEKSQTAGLRRVKSTGSGSNKVKADQPVTFTRQVRGEEGSANSDGK